MKKLIQLVSPRVYTTQNVNILSEKYQSLEAHNLEILSRKGSSSVAVSPDAKWRILVPSDDKWIPLKVTSKAIL
jgi:hypothetical protein